MRASRLACGMHATGHARTRLERPRIAQRQCHGRVAKCNGYVDCAKPAGNRQCTQCHTGSIGDPGATDRHACAADPGAANGHTNSTSHQHGGANRGATKQHSNSTDATADVYCCASAYQRASTCFRQGKYFYQPAKQWIRTLGSTSWNGQARCRLRFR